MFCYLHYIQFGCYLLLKTITIDHCFAGFVIIFDSHSIVLMMTIGYKFVILLFILSMRFVWRFSGKVLPSWYFRRFFCVLLLLLFFFAYFFPLTHCHTFKLSPYSLSISLCFFFFSMLSSTFGALFSRSSSFFCFGCRVLRSVFSLKFTFHFSKWIVRCVRAAYVCVTI